MCIKGLSYGVVIQSRPGTGKTFTTLNVMEKNNVDYAYIDSYSTFSAFYIWAYKNRNKIKIIDDVAKCLENDKFSAILKSLLWDVNGKRFVHYASTKNLEDPEEGLIPNSFEEEGSCIILVNKVNEKNIHVDAVLSRVNYVKLEIDNKEMLDNMLFVAQKPYRNLSEPERMEVYEFVKENFANSMDLNLRTLIKAFNFFEYNKMLSDKVIWKRLTLKLIKEDDALVIMEQIQNNVKLETDSEKQAEFEKLTGKKGRATYFRYKTKVRESKE
jgi:Cdc6-like AAA superfamily ATPase